jgi:hypothetical protein
MFAIIVISVILNILKDLMRDKAKFFIYFRMCVDCSEKLYGTVKYRLQK